MRDTTELEGAIIASLLLNDSQVADVIRLLSSDQFYSDAAKDAFEAIHSLWCQEMPIDAILLNAELSKKFSPDYVRECGAYSFTEPANPRNLIAYVNMLLEIRHEEQLKSNN
jgi:replicative DNA helicase